MDKKSKSLKLSDEEIAELQNIDAWYDYHGVLPPDKRKRRNELVNKISNIRNQDKK